MSLIVSDTNTLMVYENATLQWSAQLLITPIAVSRANFQVIKLTYFVLTHFFKK